MPSTHGQLRVDGVAPAIFKTTSKSGPSPEQTPVKVAGFPKKTWPGLSSETLGTATDAAEFLVK